MGYVLGVRFASFFAGAATASIAGFYALYNDYKVAHESISQQQEEKSEIGRRRKSEINNRPITRSLGHNNLVSEPRVMGDLRGLQEQFEAFLNMYQADRARQEARMDELAREVAASWSAGHQQGEASANRERDREHDKNPGPLCKPKIEFPKFDGSCDPLPWLNRCDCYFRHQNIPEEERIGTVAALLDGDAQFWFLKIDRDKPDLRWEESKNLCYSSFGPISHGNHLGELSKLQQTGSVEAYQRKFEQLSAQNTSLTSAQEIEIFISGLQEYIAVEVELHEPTTLTTAMNYARLYKRRRYGQNNSLTLTESSNSRGHSDTDNNKKEKPQSQYFKKMSRAEIEERRAMNLCFNCDEKFSPGHRCKKLFWIEGLEEYDMQGDQPEAVIEE